MRNVAHNGNGNSTFAKAAASRSLELAQPVGGTSYRCVNLALPHVIIVENVARAET